MKAVILAGGRGTRLGSETALRPKPMVEVGGRPMLWHIMKRYEHAGITDFVVCLGYLGDVIKQYFLNYASQHTDITVDLATGDVEYALRAGEPWRVTLAETGLDTETAGRLRRARDHFGDATFCLTYGDAVTDLDIAEVVRFHREHGKLATVTAVHPLGRFGAIETDGDLVVDFEEKPPAAAGWVNGGYFVLEPEVLDLIDGDETVWEHGPMRRLVADGELVAWRHDGFWHCMDTPRDRRALQALWSESAPPWVTSEQLP